MEDESARTLALYGFSRTRGDDSPIAALARLFDLAATEDLDAVVAMIRESEYEEPLARMRSKLGQLFAPFLRRHRLPLPRFNDWIAVNGKNYQVDWHWPKARLGEPPQPLRLPGRPLPRPRRRLPVIHITWNQLEVEPEAIASDLRSLLLEIEK